MKLEITRVWIDTENVNIETVTGEVRSERIADYSRLRNATPDQLQHFEYDNMGIHWLELDEDLNYESFFQLSHSLKLMCLN